MTAHMRHVGGESEEARHDALRALVAELDAADDEHPDVSVSDESGWTLSAFRSGLLVWENVEEDDEARHMTGVSRSSMATHFASLVEGDLDTIEALPWSPGYG